MPTPTIREYMSPLTFSIGKEQTLSLAAERMREHKIRHLPVLEGGHLLGILSERDISWLSSLGVDPETIPVTEAMSDLPYAVEPSTAVRDVVSKMHERKFGATLVIERGHPVGIFTTVDALRLCADLLDD